MDKRNITFSEINISERPHSLVDQNGDEKEIFKQFVMESGLSVRACNVLLTNVESLGAFELLTEEVLYSLPNCGRNTVREILNFLNTLGIKDEIQAPVSIEELFLEPPIDLTIEMLPIFSNNHIHQLSSQDLHPDFQGSIKIEDIKLSQRTLHVLNRTEMTTIGDIMLTPSSDLLSLKNFGRKSFNEIKDVVRSLCKAGTYTPKHREIESVLIDFSSYESLISSYSILCLKKDRNQQLIQKMFLFDSQKVPTLEGVGQYFGITRERVRQIVNKAIKQFKHTANISRLKTVWEKLDQVVVDGGGVIHLQELPVVLQDLFNWPTAPNPFALGQFIGIRQKGSTYKELNDLITVDCDCLNCEMPVDYLKTLDSSANDSFHVAVIGAKLSSHCEEKCSWKHPKKKFHRAFVEKMVENCNRFVLHKDLVLTRGKWLETHCSKLEDVVCHVLECHGKPMHFTEIADAIRKKNNHFKELSDHNLHSSIIRYDIFKLAGRGTYGLSSWEMKEYRSVSTAIEEFLDDRGLPQRRQQIIRHLDGEFTSSNITAALMFETRFKSIGDGIYDRPQNWQKRTLEEYIQLLPEPVAGFAQYLTGRNNTSYKLVMAFIFVRSMDQTGAIYLHKLKNMFYNFYLSRYKKDLVVEIESSTMSRIGELDKNEMINLSCRRPLESFLKSGYFSLFSQQGRKLKLAEVVLTRLDASARDILLITILKAIDDYFLAITPDRVIYETEPETPPNVSESFTEKEGLFSNAPVEPTAVSIHIRKKKRGKIKL